METKNTTVAIISIVMAWLAFLTLAIWIKALSVSYDRWFLQHSTMLMIAAPLLMLFFVTIAMIAFKTMLSRRGPFGTK